MRNELPNPDHFADQPELEESLQTSPTVTKKEFVEPKISVPVDVLEATTFFQASDTGPSN